MEDLTLYCCGETYNLVHSTEEQRARLRQHLVPMCQRRASKANTNILCQRRASKANTNILCQRRASKANTNILCQRRASKANTNILEGVANLRDMGGYEMEDGRRVKQGLLFRGGSLADVDVLEFRKFCEHYGLVQIFDFRTEGEILRAPDRSIEGLRYLWLPAIDPKTETKGTTSLPAKAYTTLHQFLIDNASNPKIQQIARGMYEEMVTNEYTQLQYAAFLQTIITTSDGAVYWHCSQGKDRTGLAAAYLLAALGASRRVVIQDYQLSNVYYEQELTEVVDLIRANGGGEEEIKVAVTFLGANVEYFSKALDVIEARYGSMYNYLTGPLCLTEKDINTLRQRYLEIY